MSRVKQALKRVALFILWPIRRFFDPRFAGIAAAMQANIQATVEANELLGRSLDELQARVDELQERVDTRFEAQQRQIEALQAEAAKASGKYFERVARGDISVLEPEVAGVLNRETTSDSFAAERGLFFNPPVWIGYGDGDVFVRAVNERVVETPYVFRQLASVPAGASVLDVGATESLVAISLASLGYQVTAIDPRPYPLEHRNLTTVVARIEDWEHGGTFDAIVCVSTIEHIGLGAYGEPANDDRVDVAAMQRMHGLVKPGGLLVLTTRFGTAGADSFQRTYDRPGLEELLEGWTIEELTIVRRDGDTSWSLADGSADADDGSEKVALVTATRP
jgi:2-polyprenyl-3-methyl-5-hydroxy-6-metoxy-1,4-benzoquinol methylase